MYTDPNWDKFHNSDTNRYIIFGYARHVASVVCGVQEMGIAEIGARKKLVEGQVAIHKAEWERSSLPKLTYHDRQGGLRYAPHKSLCRQKMISQIVASGAGAAPNCSGFAAVLRSRSLFGGSDSRSPRFGGSNY